MNKELKANIRRILIWSSLAVSISIFLSTLVLWAESRNTPDIFDVEHILWFWIVSISTVGYGDVTPQTTTGRFFAGLVIINGWIFFALLISEFNNLIKIIYKFKHRGLTKITKSKHIVIVGYNSLTMGIIHSIRKRYDNKADIVLITNNVEFNPFEGSVDFVKGDPLDIDILDQANIRQASVAFVLAEENRSNPDAYCLVVGTEIENVNQNIYTVVEITDPSLQSLYANTSIDKFISERDFIEEVVQDGSAVIEKMYDVIDKTLREEKIKKSLTAKIKDKLSF